MALEALEAEEEEDAAVKEGDRERSECMRALADDTIAAAVSAASMQCAVVVALVARLARDLAVVRWVSLLASRAFCLTPVRVCQ